RGSGSTRRGADEVEEESMSDPVHRSITLLRVALGIVVLIQAVQALLPTGMAPHGALIARILPVLAGVEILGALLIMVPRTASLGARILLPVFGVAIVLHVLHSQWNVGGLLVYAACAWVVLAATASPL